MSQPGPAANTETEPTFIDSIQFITGKDANLGSFLLVVGMVTCVFIALFQFTLPAPISNLLTVGVVLITVFSAIFASILDSLGYFQRNITVTTSEDDGQ